MRRDAFSYDVTLFFRLARAPALPAGSARTMLRPRPCALGIGQTKEAHRKIVWPRAAAVPPAAAPRRAPCWRIRFCEEKEKEASPPMMSSGSPT